MEQYRRVYGLFGTSESVSEACGAAAETAAKNRAMPMASAE